MIAEDTSLRPHRSNFRRSRFPHILRPQILGYFSLDAERTYHSNASQCKYIKWPQQTPVAFDLNIGYGNGIQKPATREKLDRILRFIVDNLSKLTNTNNIANRRLIPHIVCFRGLLRILMNTPYDDNKGWCIWATKFKGTIYLWAERTEEDLLIEQTQDESGKKIRSYGFKFEQYMQVGKFSHQRTQLNWIMSKCCCCR